MGKNLKEKNKTMSKILLIGPKQNKYDQKDTGGVTILFELLISELLRQEISFSTIDTLKANYNNSLIMFPKIILALIKNVKKHDHISLHATMNSFLLLAPIIIILAKIFSKRTSLRKFAGSMDEVYNNSNFLKKCIISSILKHTDTVFFETKYLVNTFKKYNKNTFWFPNVRDANIQTNKIREFKKRFIYIGSINKEKGIDELCEVINKLDKSYTCDLYGPIKYKSEKYSIKYFKKIGINYKGSLNANEVLETMNQYDVLVLPSHREGYPGVIIEAFSLGIPIIATKLSGIMEMCEDNKNALLIDVKQPKQLLTAIQSIEKELYIKLQKESAKSFMNFNSKIQTDLFLERINRV